jgi:hypothetical protein
MQALLTSAIESIAIIGFSGIIAHAFYHSHITWMATYCPPVKPYTPEEKPKEIIKKPEPKQEIIPIESPPEKPTNFSKMTLKDLTEICKADKEKYKEYTRIIKKGGKAKLADWMETKE